MAEREPSLAPRVAGRWRRWLLRPLIWLVTVLLVVAAALPLVLQLEVVREEIRQRLEFELERLFERDVQIAALRFGILPLTVDVAGLVVAGPSEAQHPTLAVPRLRAELDLFDLLRRRVRIERLEVDQPQFALVIDADGDSLPRPPPSGGGPAWSVAIDLVEVRDGTVFFAETTVPLDLVARGVQVDATGTGGLGLLAKVAAEDIDLGFAGLDPIALGIVADLALRDSALALRRAVLSAPGLDVEVHGLVGWEDRTRLALEFEGVVSQAFAQALGVLDDELETTLNLAGTFEWQGGSWGARAVVQSDLLVASDFALEDWAGALAVDRGGVVFDLERGAIFGGLVTGRVAYEPDDESVAGSLVAEDLALSLLLERFGVPVRGLDARLGGPIDFGLSVARWQDVVARAQLRTRGEPVGDGGLVGRVDVATGGGLLDLAWTLRSLGQSFDGGGRLGLEDLHGVLDLHVATADLGWLLGALPWSVEADWFPTAGNGTADAHIVLANTIAVTLGLELREVAAPSWRADRVGGSIELDDRGIERMRLDARLGEAAARVVGVVPFGDAPLALSFDLADWPALELAPWLPIDIGLDGLTTGSVELAGTGDALTGTLDLAVAQASIAGTPLAGTLRANLTFDPTLVRFARVELDTEAGCLVASGSISLPDGALDIDLSSSSLNLEAPPVRDLLGRAVPLELALEGRIRGSLDAPAVEASLVSGEHRLDLTWVADQLALAGQLPAGITLTGGGHLTPTNFDLKLDVGAADLAAVAQLLGFEGAPGGAARGTVEVRGGGAVDLQARLELPDLALQHAGVTIVALEPIVVEYTGDGLAIRSLYLGTADGANDFFVGGRIDTVNEKFDLAIQAGVDLVVAGQLAGIEAATRGRAELLATVRGTFENPEARGQAAIRDARIVVPGSTQAFDRLEAEVLLDPGMVILDRATARLAGGDVRLQGRTELGTSDPEFRLQLVGTSLAFRTAGGVSLGGDAELVWSGTVAGSSITGRLELARVAYNRDIETDPLRLVRGALQHQRVQVASADASLAGVQLSIAVVAPGTIRVRNNLARLDASADLVVRGSLARPELFGRVQTAPGGTFEYNGNTYEIERGIVAFVDPLRIDPRLDLVATTEVGSYDVSLTAGGTIERLELAFSSDPPLADLEVLALVAGGESAAAGLGEGSGVQTSLRTQAESLLLGQAAALIEKRFGDLFGLDTVQIEPLSTSGESVSSARVTVGRQLSRRLRATYSWDPSSTEQQRLRVEWQVDDGWTLVMTQNGDGTYSVDSRWERRF